MTGSAERAEAFVPISDKLAKLIPRLASDQSGEIVATAAAIGRTLAAAGLDWHDLTARLTERTFEEMLAAARKPTPPPPEPARPSWSPEREADFQASRRPKKEPSPWPTWSTLSHFGRLALMKEIAEHAAFTEVEAKEFEIVHQRYRSQHRHPDRKGVNLFNRASRNLWERGWRPQEARSA